MRDDEEPFEEEEPEGKLFHSGIRAQDEIQPAQYALPPGVPALQGGSPETMDQRHDNEGETRRIDRRAAIALAMGGLAIGVTAFFVGQSTSGSDDAGSDFSPRHRRTGRRLSADDLKLIEIARGWSEKPIDKLVGSTSSFLWTFHMVEADDRLRLGLERLCEYAVLHGGEKGYGVAVRILGTFEEVEPPPGFEQEFERLKEVVWRWQANKERSKRKR